MGFGGEGGGGVNLINNKFPSAPRSHALCLIALYWFFSLFFFSFFGRALLSFWNNQVAKVDLRVECHLFFNPLTPHKQLLFSSSRLSRHSFVFYAFVASQLSRLFWNYFEHFLLRFHIIILEFVAVNGGRFEGLTSESEELRRAFIMSRCFRNLRPSL